MMQAAASATRTGWVRGGTLALLLALAAGLAPLAQAADAGQASIAQPGAMQAKTAGPGTDQSNNGVAVLEAFDKAQEQRVKQASALTDHTKRLIMFAMAIPLFVLLLITGGLGVATGVYGKKLFIPHMVLAGLTISLALAHAIVGLVWFYPF